MLKYAPPTPPKYAPSPLSQFIAHPASYSAPRPPKRECLFVSTGGSTHFEALVLLFKMGMGFAMFGATVAEKFERTVEVGGRIARIASADASECSKVLPTHPE